MNAAGLLGRVAALCGRHAGWVAATALLLGVRSILTVREGLGVSTDTGALFSASLPWKQRQAELRAAFPQNEDLLVAVVDATVPEEADATAAALTTALRADTGHFTVVRNPQDSPYFRQNALLFLDQKPLADLLDRTIDAQPFLGQLAADPSLGGLAEALGLVADGVVAGQAVPESFGSALAAFHRTLAAPESGPLSWERLLAGPAAELGGRYRFVLAKPVLDYGAVQPGEAATAALRAAASGLEFVRSGAARVRITGSVALDDDEFASVATGAVSGLIGSFVLVVLWLLIALRSWRLILPTVLTLLLGLLLTAGFAAVAVGTLNLVSVAFAVLFVGLAVDFGIQFAMRFREARGVVRGGVVAALGEAGQRGGGQILVAALATAAGFLAFSPTSFAGVAQLGLIAGIGMLIAFSCTLTALPALIALFRPGAEPAEVGFGWARPLDAWLVRYRRLVLAGFAVLAAAALGLSWLVRFDSDPLHTKNQTTESVRTLNDLIADPVTSPYSIELLLPSAADAAAITPRLEALPDVSGVQGLDSLVPDDQPAKLALIADAAQLLRSTLDVPPKPTPEAAALRAAVQRVLPRLAEAAALLPASNPLVEVAHDLRDLAAAPDERLRAANAALTRFLPMQLDQLRTALQAGPVSRADLPPALVADWMTPDGHAKLEVLPKPAASQDNAGLHRFVAEVSAVAPGAAGAAVTIVRSADTVIAAFRVAAIGALAAIAIILLLALRRVLDAALVLAPLLLSALLTVIVIVLLPLPLNFANVIALPLLLGVGVSFNVYFVMNWRAGRQFPLSSGTARAVLFSGLTTATAFGSLALSQHPGTASMGALLLASLGCTLIATLTFLPALLAAVPREATTARGTGQTPPL